MTIAGRLEMILQLTSDIDEDGNYKEPILKLTNKEIIELLNITDVENE